MTESGRAQMVFDSIKGNCPCFQSGYCSIPNGVTVLNLSPPNRLCGEVDNCPFVYWMGKMQYFMGK